MISKILLFCSECKVKHFNYITHRQDKKDKLNLKKHCRFCRKSRLHQEEIVKKSKAK